MDNQEKVKTCIDCPLIYDCTLLRYESPDKCHVFKDSIMNLSNNNKNG